MKPTRFRIGKSYETIVNGILMQNSFDIYLPTVDDQGIDGVLRVKVGRSVKHYDFQIKGGKTFSRVRGNTHWVDGKMVLFLYSLDDNKLLWFQYRDLDRYFQEEPGEWGNISIDKKLEDKLLNSQHASLDRLKERLKIL